jgi:hypothetical protein
MSNTETKGYKMTTYTYRLESWFDGDTEHTVTYGKGGWDSKQARKNRDAALRRTDKVEGLNAFAGVVTDEEAAKAS